MAEHEPISKWTEKLFCYRETRACSFNSIARHILTLHVEYTERGKEYGILFIFSLFCENIHLEYVRIHLIYRVNQAEYVFQILVVAPQEYVNIY